MLPHELQKKVLNNMHDDLQLGKCASETISMIISSLLIDKKDIILKIASSRDEEDDDESDALVNAFQNLDISVSCLLRHLYTSASNQQFVPVFKVLPKEFSTISSDEQVKVLRMVEYIVAEILELAGQNVKLHKKKRVTKSHVQFGIYFDEELKAFLGDCFVLSDEEKASADKFMQKYF